MKQSCTLRCGCQDFYLYGSLEFGAKLIKCCIYKLRIIFSILLIMSLLAFFWISCLSLCFWILPWSSLHEYGILGRARKPGLDVTQPRTLCNNATFTMRQLQRKYHCTVVHHFLTILRKMIPETSPECPSPLGLLEDCLLESSFCFT